MVSKAATPIPPLMGIQGHCLYNPGRANHLRTIIMSSHANRSERMYASQTASLDEGVPFLGCHSFRSAECLR